MKKYTEMTKDELMQEKTAPGIPLAQACLRGRSATRPGF